MTIPNQAPRGFGGKRKERSDSGPAAQALSGPAGPDSKGNTAQQYYPQLRPLTFDLIQKNKPQRSWGASITPNFEGLGFPRGSKSKRACEVERLGLNRKKMARWYRRYRRSSYRRTGKHWSPTTQVVNTQTSSGSQKSLPIAFNRTGNEWGPVTRSDRS